MKDQQIKRPSLKTHQNLNFIAEKKESKKISFKITKPEEDSHLQHKVIKKADTHFVEYVKILKFY